MVSLICAKATNTGDVTMLHLSIMQQPEPIKIKPERKATLLSLREPKMISLVWAKAPSTNDVMMQNLSIITSLSQSNQSRGAKLPRRLCQIPGWLPLSEQKSGAETMWKPWGLGQKSLCCYNFCLPRRVQWTIVDPWGRLYLVASPAMSRYRTIDSS